MDGQRKCRLQFPRRAAQEALPAVAQAVLDEHGTEHSVCLSGLGEYESSLPFFCQRSGQRAGHLGRAFSGDQRTLRQFGRADTHSSRYDDFFISAGATRTHRIHRKERHSQNRWAQQTAHPMRHSYAFELGRNHRGRAAWFGGDQILDALFGLVQRRHSLSTTVQSEGKMIDLDALASRLELR